MYISKAADGFIDDLPTPPPSSTGRGFLLLVFLLSFLPLKTSAHGPAKSVITLCSFGLMQPGLTSLVPVALGRGGRAVLWMGELRILRYHSHVSREILGGVTGELSFPRKETIVVISVGKRPLGGFAPVQGPRSPSRRLQSSFCKASRAKILKIFRQRSHSSNKILGGSQT